MIRIAVEGVDGVGKSTLIKKYTEKLTTPFHVFDIPIDLVEFKKKSEEEQIIYILQIRHKQIKEAIKMETINPNITIIFDRWYTSLYMYQPLSRKIDKSTLNPTDFNVDLLIYVQGKAHLGIKDLIEIAELAHKSDEPIINSETYISCMQNEYDYAFSLENLSHFAIKIIQKNNDINMAIINKKHQLFGDSLIQTNQLNEFNNSKLEAEKLSLMRLINSNLSKSVKIKELKQEIVVKEHLIDFITAEMSKLE